MGKCHFEFPTKILVGINLLCFECCRKVYLVKRVHERSGAEYYYALKSMDKAHLKEKNLLHRGK